MAQNLRIRYILTLQPMLLVGLLVGTLLIINYQFMKYTAATDFKNRLKERAELASSIYIKKGKYKIATYQTLIKQYNLSPLPGEILQIYDAEKCISFVPESEVVSFTDLHLKHIKNNGNEYFNFGEMLCYGMTDKVDKKEFLVLVAAIDTYTASQLLRLRNNSTLFFIASLFVTGIIMFLFAGRALRPIKNVIEQVHRIEANNISMRVSTPNPSDEIGELGHTFNEMLDRLEDSFTQHRTFLSNASHELRTPLTAIIGELELLLMKDREGHQYRSAIKKVHAEAEQLKEMVNIMLSINFIEHYQQNELVEEIRIDELLIDMQNSLSFSSRKEKIVIDFENLPEHDEQITVKGNRYLLQMVMKNLIENGLKFSDQKPIHINFEYLPETLEVHVKDQGIGISKEDQERVFDTFYRAENALSYKGSGIGLMVCQRIIKLHGGIIKVNSIINQGTTMIVSLPNLS